MPSLILDDFFGDIKIELQLSHIKDVDVKNSDMVNQVFCKMKSMEEKIKILTGVNEKHLEKINTLEKSRSGIHQNKLLKEIEDLKFNLKRAEDSLDDQMEKNEDLEEEIKKLKKHYEETMSKDHGWGNALMAEAYEGKDLQNEALTEENESLKKEIKKVTSHRDRLLRFHKRDTKKIKDLKK